GHPQRRGRQGGDCDRLEAAEQDRQRPPAARYVWPGRCGLRIGRFRSVRSDQLVPGAAERRDEAAYQRAEQEIISVRFWRDQPELLLRQPLGDAVALAPLP